MLGRLLRSTGAKVVLVVLLSYMLFQAWTLIRVPIKIDSEVYGLQDSRGRVDVVVELNFRPERFHILTMQDFGRVTGTGGNTVTVRGVSQANLRELAKIYWVRRIHPLEEPFGMAVPRRGLTDAVTGTIPY